ncbi:uncharacterized protein Z518_09309 [Rhinocladiella mackenziei CBS 650.93]|uniref:Rhinocladiella mackenziei CBS 650.93 unplaced genomic scaffold supercont1.7, whole genome shotgun sequence n=1 Tax=Rhinocladiella mackenziei CBS 650.93 TaxID=1442369 RepID=A0A0D2GTE2_9EURO|nr:uncharacterized protein Z518_09309 [Rhinocladiella mackenziei CBS 650.93]KIX01583.1 hypothetical protein Z518_09309 [Rhinocladiella mackenziei CBS 650.93]
MSEGTAYVTGGASGIGRGIAQMLVKNHIKVFIADRDLEGAQNVVNELNKDSSVARCVHVDTTNWNSQEKAFSQAVADFGRIDYVYPIAGVGERTWIPNDPAASGFEMPDLTVLDVDLTGVLYTVGLAIQQFRKQAPGKNGFRGKIGCVASICGIYCVPTLPIYTAAKHAVTGFVRSYGKYLPEEKITLNSVNPNVVRTNISTQAFYDRLEKEHLLTPIEGIIETFEKLLGADDTSGECFEIGPNYNDQGAVPRSAPEFLDKESERVCELLHHRAYPLHQPR